MRSRRISIESTVGDRLLEIVAIERSVDLVDTDVSALHLQHGVESLLVDVPEVQQDLTQGTVVAPLGLELNRLLELLLGNDVEVEQHSAETVVLP